MPAPVSLFDVEPLYDALAHGELVLTPNQRLATRIRNAFVIAARRRGLRAVPTPAVYALNNWLTAQWQDLLLRACPPALAAQPLAPHQELVLWERVVAESEPGQRLLRPAAAAQQAAAAFRLALEWQLELDAPAVRSRLADSEDAETWWHWVRQFSAYCHDHGLFPQAEMPQRLLEAFDDGYLAPPGCFHLVGFEELPPLQTTLLQRLGEPRHYQSGRERGEVSRVQCESLSEEVRAAAVWAKQVLKADPAARVAIVVPELSGQRALVQRIVTEVFAPGYNLIQPGQPAEGDADPDHDNGIRRAPPFNVSAGYPLLDAPVVKAALDLLSLSQPELDLEQIEAICRSPFSLATEADSDRLACLMARCRALGSPTLSSARFRELAQACAGEDGSEDGTWAFARGLQAAADWFRPTSLGQPRGHRDWADWMTAVLSALGWPGQRSLDSIEYQQVTHWQQALARFAELETVPGNHRLTLNQALDQWRALLARQVFQPQTADSPLQILGLLEAAGLQFSHLWLTSMSARQWPPAPAPNPLLPVSLQRERGMPHASPERERRYAGRLSELFLHSADRVVISAPSSLDDNPIRPSTLFDDWPVQPLEAVLGRPLHSLEPGVEIRRRYRDSARLETWQAGPAPPLDDSEAVRGGTAILTDQSACPFRAFARHRLRLQSPPEPGPGLTPAERGELLHRALELLWKTIGSRSGLEALTPESLDDHSEQASRYAVEQGAARAGTRGFGARFQAVETHRLKKLLLAWLREERKRADFEVIATESRHPLRFAGLALNTRVDRIDRLADGSQLIIDYKSGYCTPGQWWGPRPEQPQLPLYALLLDASNGAAVNAIAFAEVSPRRCQFKGVGDQSLPESALQWNARIQSESGSRDWAEQKQHWHAALTALAEGFTSGAADVDPKHPPAQSPRTCQYCDLGPVCRISHTELVS